MQPYSHVSDLGQHEPVSLHLEAGLRVGHALIPARTLEPGSTRLEACIAASEEAVVCVSDALGDVLQHLRVYADVF